MAISTFDDELTAPGDRRVWLAYAGLCLLCWTLYGVAGTDWQRGSNRLWDALYESTWNLAPPMLLGTALLPWSRAMQLQHWSQAAKVSAHLVAALAFAAMWHGLDFSLAWWLFGIEHASATLQQRLVWRTAWALLLYIVMVMGFNGALQGRRAQAAALATARAEAELVRLELAAITGKLNPHFFFNTLNSIQFLLRKDASSAEESLLRFARMMRYLLDSRRGAASRVPLQDELDFVRDYLALESLRLGTRLNVEWAVDEATLDDQIPPLTLQPLVENCILHGIAPRVEGGTVRVEAARHPELAALLLRVCDDGVGCEWPPAAAPPGSHKSRGVGLGSLQRRFEVDYEGQARMQVKSAPGAGFQVEILIPQPELQP